MSTPSGKPFNPFDLSPYAPKRARERSGSEPPPFENDDEPAAPFANAANGALRRPAAPERAVDLDEGDERSAAPLPDPAREPRAAAGAGADESLSDADLARLESSLRWLQREGSSSRLPRAVQLPPVSGIRAVDADGSRPRGEQFINGYRVPPSLAPERLRPPPPMQARRDNLRGPIRIVLASVLAAPIAYYFSVGSWSRLSASTAQTELASSDSRPASLTTLQAPKDPMRLGDTQGDGGAGNQTNARPGNHASNQAGVAAASPPPDAPLPAKPIATIAISPNPETLPPPGLPVTASPRTVKTVRQLDPEAIKLLMQQGEQFVAAGDLVTARLVFERAAEAGDATAALAMGATYDPTVLVKLGARGIGADIDKARSWYQKAQEFGSPEAPHRIDMLANR